MPIVNRVKEVFHGKTYVGERLMKVMLTVVYMNVVTKNTKLIKLQCRERERHGRTDRNFSDGQEV